MALVLLKSKLKYIILIILMLTLISSGAAAAENGQAVTTIAGSGAAGYFDGVGVVTQFNYPNGVAVDQAGSIYIADQDNHRIRKISSSGRVTTLSGSEAGFADGKGTAAKFNKPRGLAIDLAGNLYVGDSWNNRIRKITPDGLVTTLAGAGSPGYSDGPAKTAQFNNPIGLAVDSQGNVYVADSANNRIRKLGRDGVVSTLAGSAITGYLDSKNGKTAQFNWPTGVAVDNQGFIYVVDSSNNRIRRVSPAGEVTTVAGNGTAGNTDGPVAQAQFNDPVGIAGDDAGNLYVTDRNSIRRVSVGNQVETLAGQSTAGYADGFGPAAYFNRPFGIAYSDFDGLIIADYGNQRIRKLNPGTSNRYSKNRLVVVNLTEPFMAGQQETLLVQVINEQGRVEPVDANLTISSNSPTALFYTARMSGWTAAPFNLRIEKGEGVLQASETAATPSLSVSVSDQAYSNPLRTGYYFTAVQPGGLDRLKIKPDTLELGVNSTKQFEVEGTDPLGNPLRVIPAWSVIPGTGSGEINEKGLFKATREGTVKVRATAGYISALADVTVLSSAYYLAPPVLDSLTEVVNDELLVVTGTAEPGTTVDLAVYGEVVGSAVTTADGYFYQTVNLKEGSNTITARATRDLLRSEWSAAANVVYLKMPVINDIDNHWARTDITNLLKLGIITGYPDNTFRPNQEVTRAEFAKTILNALGFTGSQNAVLDFKDATATPPWAVPYLARAYQEGLLTGYQDRTLRPNQKITRVEMAALFARALNLKHESLPNVTGEVYFADAQQIPAWAAEYVKVVNQKGIIRGNSLKQFQPANPATRAEIAAMTWRFMGK